MAVEKFASCFGGVKFFTSSGLKTFSTATFLTGAFFSCSLFNRAPGLTSTRSQLNDEFTEVKIFALAGSANLQGIR